MCGEHRFDIEPRKHIEQHVGADARLTKLEKHIMQALRLRIGTGNLVFAPAPHAMHALGDVDDLEISGKCATHRDRDGRIKPFQTRRQRRQRFIVPASRNRRSAHSLHPIKERSAFLLDQQVTDQPSEPTDILAQALIIWPELHITR